MNEDNPNPDGDFVADSSSQQNPAQRGYFFYIAIFFLLIATLCYILNDASFNWSPTVPTPVTSAAAN